MNNFETMKQNLDTDVITYLALAMYISLTVDLLTDRRGRSYIGL